MGYPRVEINLGKLVYNTKKIVNICNGHNIKVAGVTKVFCGDPIITKAYVSGGVEYIADSRIENLKKLKNIQLPKMLLRIPMISEADEIVEYSDISLNSEAKTIKAISEVAMEKNKVHKIIIMIDLGDLREGYFNEEQLYSDIEKILYLKGIELVGVGTNLTCYGGVIPNEKNLGYLVEIKENIEKKYNLNLDIVSGGNSSSLHLLFKNKMPEGINNLRLGESLVLGRETAFGDRIRGSYSDVFKLVVEVIEIEEKPSTPIGEIGMGAFGNEPKFIDRGIRKRMICAIGRQDVNFSEIEPIDEDIIVLGESSDHLILDVTDSKMKYDVGDKINFNMTYGSILSTMTSPYVEKVYL